MSIKTARKSSAAALAPTVEAHVAAITQLAAQNADAAKAVPTETLVDQALVDAFINAEGAVTESALALFYACAIHPVSVHQFVGRGDAKVRASEFNCAHVVAKSLGVKGTHAIIRKAEGHTGDKRGNVLAALRDAKRLAKELKPRALKADALAKEVGKRADAAAKVAAEKHAERRAEKRAPRTPSLPKSGTMEAFLPVAIAAFLDMEKTMARIELPQNKLAKVKDFTDALAAAREAAEALA